MMKKKRTQKRGSLSSKKYPKSGRYGGKKGPTPGFLGEGSFIGNRNGYGFASIKGMREDIFIPAAKTHDAFDGDGVKIRYTQKGGRYEGEVLSVNALRMKAIGVVCRDPEIGPYILPDCPRIPPMELPPRGNYAVGDKIEVTLPRFGGDISVLQCFGSAKERTANDRAVLAELAIETEFSKEALLEGERMAALPRDLQGRVDLRGKIIFTIDSEGAKDLDDAVSLELLPNGYLLGVHIADVSSYVRPYSALDATAHTRGTSLYFADRVVPMLPETLSNDACSLNAGSDKWALSAMLTLDRAGQIQKTEIFSSLINSRCRCVYREVNDLFEKGEVSPFYEKYKEILPALSHMRTLCGRLQEEDRARGIPAFETPEAIIALSEDGGPISIERAERGESERIIESLMLLANRAVATLLTERGIPCVYREHSEPPPEKIEALSAFLKANKLPLPWKRAGEKITLPMLNAILRSAGEKGCLSSVSTMVIRSMAKATYTEKPLPHFGLSVPLYCHFTSPIRRLSDLVTHRIIHACLLGDTPPEKLRAAAKRAATAATATELRANEAERKIESLFKAEYLSHHIDEVYPGTVSGVTAFGVYVELPNTCEGLLPLSLLPEGFVYNEEAKTLSRDRLCLTLGTQLSVRVKDADLSSGRVTFALAE